VRYKSWPIQPIFQVIQQAGNIEQQEMLRVFNMGIGLVLIVPPAEVNTIQSKAKEFSDSGYVIGEIRKRSEGSPSICYLD